MRSRPRARVANQALRLLGNDDIALLIGVLISFVTLGTMRGVTRDTILRFSNECLAPTATITLLVGAGGGFGRVLQDSGVSHAMIAVAMQRHLPLLFLAWLLAALMRLATGSATVAMTTAAGIVAPIALQTPGVSPELLAIATGAGSLIFLARERWRLLARKGVPEPQRHRNHEVVVDLRNHHFARWTRLCPAGVSRDLNRAI